MAGLAAITPASGWVGPLGAVVIGMVSSVVAYWAATWLKRTAGYDDALDVVGVHGFSGIVGTILVSFFASSALGGTEENLDMIGQLGVQLWAIAATAIYTLIVSFIILKAIDLISGLRVEEDVEIAGLDLGEHGEVGYDMQAV
ncbi:MAG: Amt family ammonium transporter [Planctomycetota bacterium]